MATVDGGGTAKYTYDAFNHRVRMDEGSTAYEFVYNQNGQRVSVWDGNSLIESRGQYYWGSQPLAWHNTNTHFQHQDYLGTERMETSYNGAVEGKYTSLPWGDVLTGAGTGSDAYLGGSSTNDAYHFAGLDHDYESNTEHAEFRNYSSPQGRWLSPDFDLGSYDFTNPQSFNRFAYVLNNPLSLVDPSGLDCVYFNDGGDGVESTDRNSNPLECGYYGGDWINGTVQSVQYFADSDTFGFRSNDTQYNYLTYANAPGTEGDGTTCFGNCDTANGYFQSPNSLPDLTQDQVIQQLATGITQDSQHSLGCIARAYGIGAPGESARYLGQPVANTKPFITPGTSIGTSPLSDLARGLPRVSGSFRAPVGGPGTGRAFQMARTGSLGVAAARYAPFLGLIADAVSVVQLYNCLGH